LAPAQPLLDLETEYPFWQSVVPRGGLRAPAEEILTATVAINQLSQSQVTISD